MPALRCLLVAFFVIIIAACNSSDRARSNVQVPLCSASICNMDCACDLTYSCDEGCASCDVECGNCRTEEGSCRQPGTDAGNIFTGGDVDGGAEPADSGTEPRDGGTEPADSGPGDTGACEFPPAQPEGGPCCDGLGVDACSLGLFCDAYDGRTQTVCYRLGSRTFGETCHDPTHCTAGDCVNGVCAREEGDSCTGPGQCPAPSICHPLGRRCQQDGQFPCHPSTHEGCAASETCLFFGDDSTMCFAAGAGTRGQPCDGPFDCAPRLVCVGIQGPPQVCVETCDPDDPNSVCPSGLACQQIGGVALGVCG